jgi:putative transposase
MPNHVHYVAVPKDSESLAKTFNACHMRYAHYFNKKNKVTGHLWQGRFFSCVLDEPHVYMAIRYVETNPVRAGLVKKPEEWDWSSAKEHLNQGKGILALADINNYMDVPNWKKYLSENENMEVIKKIRANTLNGRPLGNEKFVENLENQFGRRLKALPKGRPWPVKEIK